jgi:2-polyprenyl-3-methyl-5-hydroxy-6-metoxy-1,4-benzoquinol methylase
MTEKRPSLASKDLFKSTASYYAKYRLPYPSELFEHVKSSFGLNASKRVLDLGCGTGQLSIPLSNSVKEVVAIDANAEMIEEGLKQAHLAARTNIAWREMAAEVISPELGVFHLALFGGSFHWMDRALVLERCYEILEPGGGIAIISGGSSIWKGKQAWERTAVKVIQKWLGPDRRTGGGTFPTDFIRHEELVAQSRFQNMIIGEIKRSHVWTLEAFIGLLYSTSFANKAILGEMAEPFENDLRATLVAEKPNGLFSQEQNCGYIFAWKRY